MKSSILKRAISSVKKEVDKVYYPLRNFTAKRKIWTFVLSHGLFHLIMAFVTAGIGVYCYVQTITDKPEFKQLHISVNDSYGNPLKELDINCNIGVPNTNVFKYFHPKESLHTMEIYAAFEPQRNKPQYTSPYMRGANNEQRNTWIIVDGINSNFYSTGFSPSRINPSEIESEKQFIDSLSNNHILFYSEKPEGKVGPLQICGNIVSNYYDNPYYNFYIKLNSIPITEKTNGQFRINITAPGINHIAHYPLQIINITPTNYTYNPIEGITFDIKDVIKNGGVYMFAVDMYKKTKMERRTFIYSVLLGASIAFFLDILVNLIIKWRNLVKRTIIPINRNKGFRPRR